MGKVLLFGGLSSIGSPIIDHLLNNSNEVIAVRSASGEPGQGIEEEIELHFGRNALYQSVRADWKDSAHEVDSVIFLDTATFHPDVHNEVAPAAIKNRLDLCLRECPDLKNIIIASHIDIYGERAGIIDERHSVSPLTERGRKVDQVERDTIESLLLNRNKARKLKVFLLRLPNLYIYNPIDEIEGESLHVDDLAQAIYSLLHTTHAPCLEVIQLTSGRKIGPVQYSFEKAKEWLDFAPNRTLSGDLN